MNEKFDFNSLGIAWNANAPTLSYSVFLEKILSIGFSPL